MLIYQTCITYVQRYKSQSAASGTLTCFRPMFHLWLNQVVGFYLKWHSSIGVFKHFVGKNQLPGFYISRTLVENGLIHTKNNNGPRMDPRGTSASLT